MKKENESKPLSKEIAILKAAYQAFNNRDIDGALSNMHPDVCWPNGMEGGTEQGHAAVRSYWTRQWQVINPHVEPVDFMADKDGSIKVAVHQIVHDVAGNLLSDQMIYHVYTFEDSLITNMKIHAYQD